MQDAAELEMPVVYVRWEVNTLAKPDVSEPIQSPKFKFLRNEWRLRFHYADDEHVLRLVVPTEECLIAPFATLVHVEGSGTQQILIQLSKSTGCGGCIKREEDADDWGWTVWKKSDADIEQANNERGRDYYKLRFLVVLKKRDTLRSASSRGTQTECDVPETAGQSNSAIATSVPTTLPCLYSLSQDLAQLMVEGSQHDVEFLCACQSIKAHKLIVCRRSPVIASMLASDMVEGRTGVVTIPDMRPDIFVQFLGYVYSGQLGELTYEVALRLFEAGDQYAVHGLAKRCCEYLVEHLSLDNAYELLVVAGAHTNNEFVEKVVDYMAVNRVPLVSGEWPAFCEEHPKLAIKILNRRWNACVE